MIRRSRRHFHEGVEADLNLLPFMDVFVVLIPMFLTSAVFFPMAVLRMQAPTDSVAAAPTESLGLSIEFRDDAWIVRGNGFEARSVARTSDAAGEELGAVLASAIADRPDEKDVTIVAQERTRYDDIVSVMDVARAAGLSNVALAPNR
jgi:biopolymer transport protein ExbD